MSEVNKHYVGAYLTKELNDKVQREIQVNDVSASYIIRKALHEYFIKKEVKK